MLDKSLSYIANYFWKESLKNISVIMSDEEKKKFNIADYYYLTAIYFMGTPKIGEIAKELELTKPAITALIKRLESNGLITKWQSSDDKRVFYLELTQKGRGIVEGDNTIYRRFTGLMQNLATEEQMRDIECLMQKIVEVIKTEAKK